VLLVQNRELQALAVSTKPGSLRLVRTNSSITEPVNKMSSRCAMILAWSYADSWSVPRSNVTGGVSRWAIIRDFCSSLSCLLTMGFMEHTLSDALEGVLVLDVDEATEELQAIVNQLITNLKDVHVCPALPRPCDSGCGSRNASASFQIRSPWDALLNH
jgi:hypothetical protein